MKYRLTDETKITETEDGIVLRRICALRDIPRHGVSKGDLGGWVENESNLDQDGDAWIGENAMVFGNAQVYGNAVVSGDAVVYENAVVYGDAEVFGNAQVYGNAVVSGDAVVSENAHLYGDAWVCENAWVSENAKVCGNAKVGGNAEVSGDAVVCSSADYLVFKNSWSSYRWFTYTRYNKMWRVGCFYGTSKELIKKAYADSDIKGKCYEATVKYVEAIESATAKKGTAK